MEQMTTYLQMGGYAAYVWPAFAAAVTVLAALLVASLRSLRAREAELAELQRRAEAQPRRRARAASVAREETT